MEVQPVTAQSCLHTEAQKSEGVILVEGRRWTRNLSNDTFGVSTFVCTQSSSAYERVHLQTNLCGSYLEALHVFKANPYRIQ
jgi:hypothetical protein